MQNISCAATAEINLKYARENVETIRRISQAHVFAVIKADAYSHGAARLAPELLRAGAAQLCVATPEEGIELREHGIEAPVIVLNPAAPTQVETLIKHNLTPAVGDIKTADIINSACDRQKKTARIHIEVDTGMGRSGFPADESLESVKKLLSFRNIYVEGIFTHFACADEEDPAFTNGQMEKFFTLTERISHAGIEIPYIHTSNSAGIISFHDRRANAVRPGLFLYGISPLSSPPPTKPLLTLKTIISNVRRVPAGTYIGYGRTCLTDRTSDIATLPVGYADGYDRRLSSRAHVLIGGRRAPVAGRICMDRFLVDITGIRAKTGDEAVLIGRQHDEVITVEELSRLCNTITNDFITGLGKRIKRIYVEK